MSPDPRAVLTRPAPPPDLTVRYGEHPDHVADLWLPTTRSDRPLVIFIHGGFWRAEYDRAHVGPLAADLAGRGWPVAAFEYRRLGQPGGGWPGTLDDVTAAIDAVPRLVAEAGAALNPGAPILAGHSAGGQLALWSAARAPERTAGVLALAPVCDLARAYAQGLGGGAVGELLGGGPAEVPERYAEADPLARLPLRVPAVLVHGVEDELVPVALARGFVNAARLAGDSVELAELPGVEHFGVIDPESAAWSSVLGGLRTLAPSR